VGYNSKNAAMKIIVPYRNRPENLEVFLKEYSEFDILIVEQEERKLFNRGKLMNIGFNECKDDIVCFHDVDLIAENKNIYNQYVEGAIHLSGLCSQFNYKKPYADLFGGVVMFDALSFLACNGFSNSYWGWGGEDDDLYKRTILANVKVDMQLNRYKSLNHEKQPITAMYDSNKNILKQTDKLWQKSGLNSMRYEIIELQNISDNIQKIKVNL
jgi:beta-1,4-galactosyltransferase 1